MDPLTKFHGDLCAGDRRIGSWSAVPEAVPAGALIEYDCHVYVDGRNVRFTVKVPRSVGLLGLVVAVFGRAAKRARREKHDD